MNDVERKEFFSIFPAPEDFIGWLNGIKVVNFSFSYLEIFREIRDIIFENEELELNIGKYQSFFIFLEDAPRKERDDLLILVYKIIKLSAFS